ncbi:MAG: DNA-binding protein [Flavobacterium sp.]|nr:MAG: DNA-binding protein [Flavobacterium sp.]
MAILDLITNEDLKKFKAELFEELKLFRNTDTVEQSYLRSSEVRKILRISPGTLQNLRIKELLPYEKIGSIFYYAKADIKQLLGEIGNS